LGTEYIPERNMNIPGVGPIMVFPPRWGIIEYARVPWIVLISVAWKSRELLARLLTATQLSIMCPGR